MPLDTPHAAPAAHFHVDHARHAIRFVRRLKATPEQAFDAWTQPEQLSVWWDPNGRRLARCEIDLRVGGQFLFDMDGHHPFGGVYEDIARPERLVFNAMGARGTVLFAAVPGGTEMTVTIACDTANQLKEFLKVGVAEGTSQTLNNLVAFFA